VEPCPPGAFVDLLSPSNVGDEPTEHEEYSTTGEKTQCSVRGERYGVQAFSLRTQSSLDVQNRRVRVQGASRASGNRMIRPLPWLPPANRPAQLTPALRSDGEALTWRSL
jgi:hypothetical protein